MKAELRIKLRIPCRNTPATRAAITVACNDLSNALRSKLKPLGVGVESALTIEQPRKNRK
jgi:hypothetical protein